MAPLVKRSAEIPAEELAAWIEQQGLNTYWTVDGDPLLSGRLDVPCPGDELAAEVRKINRPLRVIDPMDRPNAVGRPGPRLDDFVESEELRTRVLQLQWMGRSGDPWLLIEDKETTESVAREAAEDAAREA